MAAANVAFKVLLRGKAGVGKSATLARVCSDVPQPVHIETHGICVRDLTWKFQDSTGKDWAIEYNFWDVGGGPQRFDYIMENAIRNVDAFLYFCAATDRSSMEELDSIMNADADAGKAVRLVAVTKYDMIAQREISMQDCMEMSNMYNVIFCQISNFPIAEGAAAPPEAHSDIERLLNALSTVLMQKRAGG